MVIILFSRGDQAKEAPARQADEEAEQAQQESRAGGHSAQLFLVPYSFRTPLLAMFVTTPRLLFCAKRLLLRDLFPERCAKRSLTVQHYRGFSAHPYLAPVLAFFIFSNLRIGLFVNTCKGNTWV